MSVSGVARHCAGKGAFIHPIPSDGAAGGAGSLPVQVAIHIIGQIGQRDSFSGGVGDAHGEGNSAARLTEHDGIGGFGEFDGRQWVIGKGTDHGIRAVKGDGDTIGDGRVANYASSVGQFPA